MHEITVREDGTISTADAAILCGVRPVSIRARIRRGQLREVRREKRLILVYLLDIAKLDREIQGRIPYVAAEVSWRLDGEPDVDILSVFRACDELAQQVAPPEDRHPVVYYLRFADRIKIGTSTCLRSRMEAVPHDEVLATEPGGVELEEERKMQFVEYRVTGEWFRMAPALMRHIEKLRVPSFACATPDM